MCTQYERFVCFGECNAQHLVRSEQSNSVVITLVQGERRCACFRAMCSLTPALCRVKQSHIDLLIAVFPMEVRKSGGLRETVAVKSLKSIACYGLTF